ncbi:putative ABC transporter permease YknZ [Paenibacillus larvae subsp. larvae]|uniref:Putative ABC transporter permease YknZ n=1 Tax=Paenibacillus larvae subsp. larvae TaxID=147375 RepID=A0A2L1UEU3_9BACL|nr:FtsX-like permease family protein [Paenibacillus larvae]AVF26674.1 putative ABC transporter permease YknZ [Paenibacillus larvae subsp. larvae]AVF31421.1 putative ABC transporter permease YknZ [Paenibacillus larvae subsp. larvae]MCY9774353.1 FtsX-like permease family protein [Paenibacillus larvae]
MGLDLTITGILRVKDGAPSNFLSEGIVYPTALTDYIVDNASKSDVAIAQKASDKDIILNTPFANDDAKKARLQSLGANTTPTAINIYPKDFASKDKIKTYLDSYNTGKADENKVIYTDLAETINNMMNSLIKTISYVLIGFAAISLLVSTIMIGIITYISVLERTKEIGILRSVGARKKDIGRVFNAETMIVGCIAGLLGVGLSYLLILPINMVIKGLANIPNLANLNPISAIVLIFGSMVLTLIAGLIPSRMAAKKDPVRALRSE